MSDITQALPYKNEIKKIQIKGSTLKKVFEHSAEQLGEGGFLQVCVLFQDMYMNFYIDHQNDRISYS